MSIAKIVDSVLIGSVKLAERMFPGPERLGRPLPAAARASDRRDPVVLVTGFANTGSSWREWKRSLEADGFTVYVLDIPRWGLGDVRESVRLLGEFVKRLRLQTGARKVDVVGFSEGGVIARMYTAGFRGRPVVDTVVTVATPHRGVALDGFLRALQRLPLLGGLVPEAAAQLVAGSELIRSLNRRGVSSDGARYTSIYAADHDGFVSPKSAHLEGATNVVVAEGTHLFGTMRGPNHFSMIHHSHAAYEAARAALLSPAPAAIADAIRGAAHVRRRSKGVSANVAPRMI